VSEAAGRAGPRRLRVIVVDDDHAVAFLHQRLVDRHADCMVIATVHTGPAAVAAISAHTPDLVLLDFSLPGMSGLDVLRTVRASSGPQPEVIAVTAARDVESVREARAAGIRHYLVKPFSPADLSARLDAAVRDAAALAKVARPSLDQTQIDALFTGGPQDRAHLPSLPKGLSAETLAIIETALAAAPGSSSSEIGAATGLSRVSTRRYLEYLVELGRAARELDYATSGRPSTRYRPVPRVTDEA
jgi:response regulator of citrate/malate metabolism